MSSSSIGTHRVNPRDCGPHATATPHPDPPDLEWVYINGHWHCFPTACREVAE